MEYRDLDNTVRGEALLARVKLEQEPENVFYDALSAIRSNEADYQGYGLRALEQIATLKAQNEVELSWANDYEAKALFSELMNPEFDDMPAELRKAADDLQERFFEFVSITCLPIANPSRSHSEGFPPPALVRSPRLRPRRRLPLVRAQCFRRAR